MTEYLKEQLEEQKKEKKLYQNLLHGYLGLVNVERKDLPEGEKKALKSIQMGGKTFAHQRRYLEKEFRVEKEVTVPVDEQ